MYDFGKTPTVNTWNQRILISIHWLRTSRHRGPFQPGSSGRQKGCIQADKADASWEKITGSDQPALQSG